MSVTKIYTRKVEREWDYATSDGLLDQLRLFEKQMGWLIFEKLRILKEEKADTISITKERPFHYFYARLSKGTIFIRLQTSERETEFRLPIEEVK